MKNSPALRILFAGTPGFAVVPLEALIAQGFKPLAVLTQPDRPAGRGRELQASPVKRAAEAAAIPVHQPGSLRDAAALELLKSLAPDLVLVVAYGLMLPAAVLELPRYGCWNIHASLLPRWRGAAPIQRAIEAGDAESGVTIMRMDAGLDTGPMLLQRRLTLADNETAGSLHDRLAALGAEALLDCLHRLQAGNPPDPVEQPERGVSYASKLLKEEARLDWREPARLLERRVRAFDPWPVAWCQIGSERTRIWTASLAGDTAEQPGTVIAANRAGIDVATAAGVLRLLQLQPPGGRILSAAEYLNGRSPPKRLDGPA